MTVRTAENNNDPPTIVAPAGLEFQITYSNVYTPVVNFSAENNKKLLEQLKSWFKRTVKWNEYRSQMTIQSNNNNLNYLIDPTFTKVNRLFVLSFEGIDKNDVKKEILFSHYYVPNIEKGLNVLTDGKSSFAFPVKNEEEAYENIIEMSRNNDYTTGNSLDFAYFKENYRLIAFNLNNKTKLKDTQKIYFIGSPEWQNNGATMLLIIANYFISEQTAFKFLQYSAHVL